MDNFHIDVNGSMHRETFDMALQLGFGGQGHRQATHYWMSNEYGLVVAWHENASKSNGQNGQDFQPLPYPMSVKAFSVHFTVQSPISTATASEAGGSWGHVGENVYTFLAVQPDWCLYGK